MTSYQFFKMAAIESEMCFRVGVYQRSLFKKVGIYMHVKLRWDISIHGWDKTTSGFGKRTAAILKSYFRLHIRPILVCLPNFFVIGRSSVELWCHIHFVKMAAILDLRYVMFDYPRNAISGLRSVLQFGLARIYSFGDIAIFVNGCFGLKLPVHALFFGGGRGWLRYDGVYFCKPIFSCQFPQSILLLLKFI